MKTIAFLVIVAVAGAAHATCPDERELAGSFWLVSEVPRLCADPMLAPWRALPGARQEIVAQRVDDGAWRAVTRWSATGSAALESEPSQPWKVLPAAVAPDTNGDGRVTATDATGFLADFVRGSGERSDWNGDGLVTAGDARGFIGALGGQIR